MYVYMSLFMQEVVIKSQKSTLLSSETTLCRFLSICFHDAYLGAFFSLYWSLSAMWSSLLC